MNDDGDNNNKEISNQSSDQKNEKRKKKKRRGKTLNAETNEQSNSQVEPVLPTVLSIISGEENKLPIDDPSQKISGSVEQQKENIPQKSKRLRGRRKDEEPKEKKEINNYEYGLNPNSNEIKTMDQHITYKEDSFDEKLKIEIMDEKEKQSIRQNMGKFFKRANPVENERTSILRDDDKGEIPSKDIDPYSLFTIDEEDGEIDYLEAQKAYDLSVFLDSHKFIKNKKFDKPFVNLVKRQIIRFERNLVDLVQNDKFFILYEVQMTDEFSLCLTEIVALNAIKSVLLAYPSVHLVLLFSDEELFNEEREKYYYSFLKELAEEKLKNILIYLNFEPEEEKRIHALSTLQLKEKNKEFENEKNKLKELLNKKRLRKYFDLVTKEEEKNDTLLDYPCHLAVSANPLTYMKYIPEITEEHRCLIINSIFFMYRYQLCFDAAKVLSFKEPAVIALKIVPPITGVNGCEAFYDLNEKTTILSSDQSFSLNKKLNDYSKEEGNNPNTIVACQYLSFLEEDNDNYNDAIKRFESGKIDVYEIRKKVSSILQDLFQNFRSKDRLNIDISNIMINVSQY